MAPSGYIPPPFAAVDDTGYHVKGQLTHTQYTQLGPLLIKVLNGKLCIFLSAYIPRFGVGWRYFFIFFCTLIVLTYFDPHKQMHV